MIRRLGAIALSGLVALFPFAPVLAGEGEATLVAHGAAMLRTTIYSADPGVLGFIALAPFFDADLQALADEPEFSPKRNLSSVRIAALRRMLVTGDVAARATDTTALGKLEVTRPADPHRWWLVQLGLADAQIHASDDAPGAISHTNYLYEHRNDAGAYAHLLDGDGLTSEIDAQFPQPAATRVATDATPQGQAQRGLATLAAVSVVSHPSLAGQPAIVAFISATMQADLVDAPDQQARNVLATAVASGDPSGFRALTPERWAPAFVTGYFIAAGCANATGTRDSLVEATLRKQIALPAALDALPAYAAARAAYLATPLGDWSENYRRLRDLALAIEGPTN